VSRKQPIPGVDETALAELAGQFPSGFPRADAPPAQDNAPPPLDAKESDDVPPVASTANVPAKHRAPGRGLAICAMVLALVAVFIAATSVMPLPVRSWLARTLGDSGFANFVTGNRADIDKRLAAASQSIDALAGKQSDVAARLEAIETVVGSGAATRRLDAVEAGLGATNQRLLAAAAADRLGAARVTALDAKMTAVEGDLKTVQDKLAAQERDVGEILTARLGAVEANVGVLQKIDRRPEKFFLAALQLRDRARTAGSFAHEVAVAQALAGQNADLVAALKILAGDADHGVATVAELRDNFTSIVHPRLAAVAGANRQPVASRAWDWVKSLFTTAASAEPTGDRNMALIALAARSLDQGQLEAAVHQLLLLEDEAALVAAEWLKNASARLAADKAVATIMSQALDQLAASN
jgi:hypothetical protein